MNKTVYVVKNQNGKRLTAKGRWVGPEEFGVALRFTEKDSAEEWAMDFGGKVEILTLISDGS